MTPDDIENQDQYVGWAAQHNAAIYHESQRQALVTELERGIRHDFPPGVVLRHLTFDPNESQRNPQPHAAVLPWGALVGIQGRTGVVKTAFSATAVAYALLEGAYVTYLGVDTSSAVRFAYRVAQMVRVAATWTRHHPLCDAFPWSETQQDDHDSDGYREGRNRALERVVTPAAVNGQLYISTPSTRRRRDGDGPPQSIYAEDLIHLMNYRRRFADAQNGGSTPPRHLLIPDFAQQLSLRETGFNPLERYERIANHLKDLLVSGDGEDESSDLCILLPMQSNRTEGVDTNARTRGSDDWGQVCDLLYLGVRGYESVGRAPNNERFQFKSLVVSKDRDAIYANCMPDAADPMKGMPFEYYCGGIRRGGVTHEEARKGNERTVVDFDPPDYSEPPVATYTPPVEPPAPPAAPAPAAPATPAGPPTDRPSRGDTWG